MHNQNRTQTIESNINDNVDPKPPKIFIYLILSLAILAIGLTAGYYIGQSSSQNTPKPTKTLPTQNTNDTKPVEANQDISDDWKIYLAEEYGFSFKYPKDWTLEGKTLSSPNSSETLSIMINIPFGIECFSKTKEQNIVLDRVKANKTTFTGVESDLCDIKSSRLISVNTNINDNVINLLYGFSASDEKKALETLNTILSTFKFIKKANTTTKPTSAVKIP